LADKSVIVRLQIKCGALQMHHVLLDGKQLISLLNICLAGSAVTFVKSVVIIRPPIRQVIKKGLHGQTTAETTHM